MFTRKKLIKYRIERLILKDQPRLAFKWIERYQKSYKLDDFIYLSTIYVLLRLGEYEQSREMLKLLEKDDANKLNYIILKGLQFDFEKEFQLAVDLYTQGLSLHPDSAELFNNRGFTYLEMNENEKALVDFNKAISLKPRLAFAYNNRGLAKLRLNDQSAIKDIKKSIRMFENNAMAYKNWALWEWQFGNRSKIPKLLDRARHRAYFRYIQTEVEELENKLIEVN